MFQRKFSRLFLLIIGTCLLLFALNQLTGTYWKNTIELNKSWKQTACPPIKISQQYIRPIVKKDVNTKYLYANNNTKDPMKFNLSSIEPNKNFFVTIGKHTCFVEGTESISSGKGCQCAPGYFGKWCSIPAELKSVKSFNVDGLKLRSKPRKVIFASPFNHEFEMLEARLAELGDVVDVFVFGESNYTAHGDKRELLLLKKLRNGYLNHMQHKICHVFYGFFPKEGYKDGWLIDDLMRDVLGQGIMEQISGVKHDDVIMMTDSDELPNRQTVLFLKFHDGYPEPITVALDKRVYGFFWQVKRPHIVGFASTFGFLWHVFDNKVKGLRNPIKYLQLQLRSGKLGHYKAAGGFVKLWQIGGYKNLMGWHCSWCSDPEGIQKKLISAINADFPRWGDYPEKKDLNYIKSLVKTGMWFDGKSTNSRLEPDISKNYAPKYMIENWNKYKDILENPYS